MTSSDAPRDGGFSKYVFIGLAWEILAGLVSPALLFSLALVVSKGINFSATNVGDAMMATTQAVLAALWFGLALALVPIGPLAALFSWPLYRLGASQRWLYALVGALSAVSALIVMIAIEDDLLKFRFDSFWLMLMTWLALGGAFGGAMGARVAAR